MKGVIMRLKWIIVLIIFSYPIVGLATPFEYETCNLGWKHVQHRHNEASYQHIWCSLNNGIEEYENSDKTRVDCLTKTHAVEFDFANKWAESIGQALHYQVMTGKRAKIVLILDNPKQMVYFKRIQYLSKIYNFDVKYITDKILNLNKDGTCSNPKCKCHKK